jgi:cytochrome c oxidase subunit II
MWTLVSAGMLMVGACSSENQADIKRLAMPEPATDRGVLALHLWQGAWIAALLVGVLVWGLIGYASFKFRRRSDDEIPVQTRYNLPIEILYTVAPIIMVLVFFYFTVQTQNDEMRPVSDTDGHAAHTIDVVGSQWSWTFNYVKDSALDGKTTVHTIGTPAEIPTLWLPVNESVTVNLSSPDVAHSFWVPAFLMKMDVIPGRHNHFSFTPIREGEYAGRCAELCGVYHSRMLFNLKVVTADEYAAHLRDLQTQKNTGLALGGSEATTQSGLQGQAGESGQTGLFDNSKNGG